MCHRFRLCMILGCLGLLGGSAVSANQPLKGIQSQGKKKVEGITGTWDNVAKAPNGLIFKYQMVLIQKGEKLTGYVFDPLKNKKKEQIFKGKVQRKKVTFYHYGDFEGKKYKASYEGKIGRSGIKGQIEVESDDDGDFLIWNATRANIRKDRNDNKSAKTKRRDAK
ncbi:MAG: hypothetical protein ACFCD0_25875 [Gemmataceae bacterium]